MNGSGIVTLLNMSITGGIVIVLILILRLFLGRMPKKYVCLLWLIPVIRLLLPVTIPSPLSLLPVNGSPITETAVTGEQTMPLFNTGVEAVDNAVNLVLLDNFKADGAAFPTSAGLYGTAAELIWAFGALLLISVNGYRYGKLKKAVRTAIPGGPGSFYADGLDMPMVIGILKPRIFLPAAFLKEGYREEKEFILAHERAHVLRRDHLTKLLAFAALTVHWFNPLAWLAFFLFGRDMEMACDELVMEQMGEEKKKGYSLALLHFEERRSALLLPLAFGESNTKSRIRNILNYKKPGFWAGAAALIVIAACAVTLLTDPAEERGTEDAASIGIIGGADGPTTIFLAGKLGNGGEEEKADAINLDEIRKQPYGVGVELDYVSAEKISLHGYFGYMVFDFTGGNGTGKAGPKRAITLSEAGGISMQGDTYTEIVGSEGTALIVTNAYGANDEDKQVFFYSEEGDILEEQTDDEMREMLFGLADQGIFKDARTEDVYTGELADLVRTEYGSENGLLYGPCAVPEFDSNVYGFLAADGGNVEDIWYGLWNRDTGRIERMELFAGVLP